MPSEQKKKSCEVERLPMLRLGVFHQHSDCVPPLRCFDSFVSWNCSGLQNGDLQVVALTTITTEKKERFQTKRKIEER